MNIKQFKEGDIITRVSPCQYGHNGIKDGSYLGERAILLGHDEKTKLIFLDFPDSSLNDEPHDLSYGRDRWDEGWEYYPETMWQKIKSKFNKTAK